MSRKKVVLAIAAMLCLALAGAYWVWPPGASYGAHARRGLVWQKAIKDIVSKGFGLYEPPQYDFKLDEVVVEIPVGGEDLEKVGKTYDIAFVNDLHLITDDEPGDVLEEHLRTVRERHDALSVTPEGICAEELWPEVIKFLNYHDFDAIIFGGDMLDYGSHSNLRALAEGFANLKYPKEKIMYLRSDHDYGGWYGGSAFTDADGALAQAQLLDGDRDEQWMEFDEFIIAGVSKSYRNLTDGRLAFLMGKLNAGKPVIVASHVPFYSKADKSLEEKSKQVRGRIYYWNPEDSPYRPDENTQKLIDCMYGEDSGAVQILAAHLHAAWDGKVTDKLKEHIFAPSYEGGIGIVRVKIVDENEKNAYGERFFIPTQVHQSDGRFYLADAYNNQILYTDRVGNAPDGWKTLDRNLNRPHAIASDGTIYLVTDTDNHRIATYAKTDAGGYQLVESIENVGIRPHDAVYDEVTGLFYVWSSMTGTMYLYRREEQSLRLNLEQTVVIPELEGQYTRSFTIRGNTIYFPCVGASAIYEVDAEDFRVKAAYPVAAEISEMIQVLRIQNYYYLLTSGNRDKAYAVAMVARAETLEGFGNGNYENITSMFGELTGTPYYITQGEDGHYYAPVVTGIYKDYICRFDIVEDVITNVEHMKY